VRRLLLAALYARHQSQELIVHLGHLLEVCAYVSGVAPLAARGARKGETERRASELAGLDLGDVRGQWLATRALGIAAVSAHRLLRL